jgi:hypothetical protein
MSSTAPAHASSDRNLLYGMLALQMGFVSRDDLLAGMHAWVLDKQQPLGELLQERGSLSASQRQVLDAVVAEHLKAHGDDPQRSLAALGQAPTLNRAFQHVADLAGIVAHAATSAYEPRADGARYENLRPHARGALGVVSVARDVELGREVALKEIDADPRPHAA